MIFHSFCLVKLCQIRVRSFNAEISVPKEEDEHVLESILTHETIYNIWNNRLLVYLTCLVLKALEPYFGLDWCRESLVAWVGELNEYIEKGLRSWSSSTEDLLILSLPPLIYLNQVDRENATIISEVLEINKGNERISRWIELLFKKDSTLILSPPFDNALLIQIIYWMILLIEKNQNIEHEISENIRKKATNISGSLEKWIWMELNLISKQLESRNGAIDDLIIPLENIDEIFEEIWGKFDNVMVTKNDLEIVKGFYDHSIKARLFTYFMTHKSITQSSKANLKSQVEKSHGTSEIADFITEIRIKDKIITICIPIKSSKEIQGATAKKITQKNLNEILKPFIDLPENRNVFVCIILLTDKTQDLLSYL